MSATSKPLKKVTSFHIAESTMSTFESIRTVTGWQRPTQNHGCAPCVVFPGIYTAHFHEMDSREKLFDAIQEHTLPRKPTADWTPEKEPYVLVVNSAPCQCVTTEDFYGPGVHVLSVDLEDDPDEKKQFDQGKAVTSNCASKVRTIFYVLRHAC